MCWSRSRRIRSSITRSRSPSIIHRAPSGPRHKHGSVAAHLASGMAGMLVIEGTQLDQVPAIKKAEPKVFVFQQIPYVYDPQVGAGVVELKYVDQMFPPNTWDPSGRFTTINGQVLPVMKIRPGEVRRWRFVHAGLRVDPAEAHEGPAGRDSDGRAEVEPDRGQRPAPRPGPAV